MSTYSPSAPASTQLTSSLSMWLCKRQVEPQFCLGARDHIQNFYPLPLELPRQPQHLKEKHRDFLVGKKTVISENKSCPLALLNRPRTHLQLHFLHLLTPNSQLWPEPESLKDFSHFSPSWPPSLLTSETSKFAKSLPIGNLWSLHDQLHLDSLEVPAILK